MLFLNSQSSPSPGTLVHVGGIRHLRNDTPGLPPRLILKEMMTACLLLSCVYTTHALRVPVPPMLSRGTLRMSADAAPRSESEFGVVGVGLSWAVGLGMMTHICGVQLPATPYHEPATQEQQIRDRLQLPAAPYHEPARQEQDLQDQGIFFFDDEEFNQQPAADAGLFFDYAGSGGGYFHPGPVRALRDTNPCTETRRVAPSQARFCLVRSLLDHMGHAPVSGTASATRESLRSEWMVATPHSKLLRFGAARQSEQDVASLHGGGTSEDV